MEVKEVLFMNKGDGENSYAQASLFTQKLVELSKPVLESAVKSLFEDCIARSKVLKAADLGCSSGPSSFSVMSSVIETAKKKCDDDDDEVLLPEFQFYLNDLPGNDFNTLFKGFSSFCERYKEDDVSVFIMGAPGSFHGRLFPRNSLHLVHSSYSVHWLSKVPRLTDDDEAGGLPLNKGKIHISKTSPCAVKEAYLAQFQQDFTLFLKSRSQEMVPNGRLVLLLKGRSRAEVTRDDGYPFETLAEAIAALVSEGLIEEEKLDSFNVPFYDASKEEIKDVVKKEGSFAIEQLDAFSIEVGDKNVWKNAQVLAKNVRSFTESMISYQFGEEILDKLYEKFTQITIQDLAANQKPYKTTSLCLKLRKN